MRKLLPGLASPYPLGSRLPVMYAGNRLTQAVTGTCDELLAPVLCDLDNLHAYLDPRLAPPDFVAWLGSWLGQTAVGADPELLRQAVAAAGGQLRSRGTAAALAAEVALVAGVRPDDVDVVESGGTAWSTDPMAQLPGHAAPTLAVRVRAADPAAVDSAAVEAAVTTAKPAHVPHTITVVRS